MIRRRRCVALLLLLAVGVVAGSVAATGAPAAVGADGASTDAAATQTVGEATTTSTFGEASGTESGAVGTQFSEEPVVERVEHRPVDGDHEVLAARITYEIPENVEELRFQLTGGQFEVQSADGFERTDEGAFEWDGVTEAPAVTIRHRADESFRAENGHEQFTGATDDWAVAARPQTKTGYSLVGEDPGVEYEYSVAGEGVAGQRLAFLGPYEAHDTEVAGEAITLAVPAAADLESSPADILDAIAYASDRLRFGRRNDDVLVVAAPVGEVDWEPRGLAVSSDTRIAADARVDGPVAVWPHEYVHTRQYRDHAEPGSEAVADDARWLIEATADYYAALLSLEQGRIDYGTFEWVLERGTKAPVDDAVLAEPDTWEADAEYRKGALVAAAVDAELRAATDGDVTLQTLIRDWNRADTFTADDLEAAAEREAGPEVAEFVRQYTRTDATPPIRDRETHAEYFEDGIAQFDYAVTSEPAFGVHGPYRSGDLPRTVVTGETVETTVTVANVGEAGGTYRSVLAVGGEDVDVATGVLAPGESQEVTLAHRFDETGDVTVTAGDQSRSVTVERPAEPTVTSLTVGADRDPVAGEPVDVSVGVANAHSRPANGTVTVRSGETTLATERVTVGSGANDTVETTVTFDSAGTHDVRVDGLDVSVTVREAGPLDRVPGFGAAGALVALVVVTVLLGRRSR